MQCSVLLQEGGSKVIELSEAVFGCPVNEPLIHQVITACLANQRQGTHAQKTRAEVRGGGRKPWRQKGSGRARAGSIRSPIWRKGGVTFAAKSGDYSQKINRKMYRSALRSVLSHLIQMQRLMVIDTLTVAQPKTREVVNQLKALNLYPHTQSVDEKVIHRAMLVMHEFDETFYLATRNLSRIRLCAAEDLDIVDLVRYPRTIMTLPVLKKLEEHLQ